MKIELNINIDKEYEKSPFVVSYLSIVQIISKFGLTKNMSSEIFTKILENIDERQKISEDIVGNGFHS